MTWLALLRAVLSLANSIASIVREKQLMDAGEARNIAKQMTELTRRLEIGSEVMAQIETMADAELDEELRE